MDNNNNNNNNQASSPGKALGGGGSGGSSTALSPADIRRKRLEALDKRQQQQQQQQHQRPSPAAGTSSSSQGNQQPNQAVAKPPPPPQQSSSPAVQPTTVSGTNTTATPSNPINNSTTTTTPSANPLPDPAGNNKPAQVTSSRGSPATSTTAAGSSSSLSSSAAAVPPPVAAQQQQPPPPPPSADPPIISRHPFPSIHNNNNNNYNRTQEEEDYDDEELQRALALSMAGDTTTDEESSDGNPNEEETTTTTPEKQMEKSLHIEPKFENNNPMMAFMNNNNNNNNSHNKTTTTMPCNILNFHYIMWDYPGITTENDQQRWLNQGINFKYVDAHLEACQSNTTTADSVMAAIILHYESWGLTQTHGGPCGVLASIQAEMLRLLLFGPRTVSIIDDDDNDNTSPSSGGGDTIGLEYPTQITNSVFESPADLHPPLLRKALAMSMAIIWTRASMAATAAASDSNASSTTSTSTSSTGGSPTTASTTTGTGTSETTTTTNTTNTTAGMNLNPSVHIVLPKLSINAAALEWNHLEPWTSDTGGGGQSDHLVTYTISLYDDIGEEGMDTTPTVAADGGGSSSRATSASSAFSAQQPHTKRPRVKSIGNYTEEEIRVLHALSHKVANFLCDTNALEWFQRPGGVLLMVMSLAMSRGIPNIQGDMDDPTAKLTSNFGHCSQELINLLLTGQAVSNVFDNTMRPSGELICRGIQSRPAIGYLSQLESMRYLEVGGYYKTPQFPIWVIGSTSHFTVLFGEVACLQESASDVLLEKVRRAFKRIDENESGFIQTQQLGEFLGLVDLTPTIVSEHAIPTLAATMEVHGAGIILWEDLWKRTSRLLTGATLETVLEWNGESLNAASSTSTAIVPVPEPQPIAVAAADASSSAEILSDEEYARRLQAELNGEIIPAPAPIAHQPNPQSPQPAATAATTTSQQAETYGKTFQLYHYNGLRGGTMKPFRVTRLSADEAIGASVSLGSHSHANHHNMMMGGGNAGGDLEDVLRSKWPSCKINWLGGHPPSID